MKTEIVLKKTGQRVHTHKETARLLIEMGRAVTVEDHLAAKCREAEAADKAAHEAKADANAEGRKTKVVEPVKRKTRRADR